MRLEIKRQKANCKGVSMYNNVRIKVQLLYCVGRLYAAKCKQICIIRRNIITAKILVLGEK